MKQSFIHERAREKLTRKRRMNDLKIKLKFMTFFINKKEDCRDSKQRN